MTLVATNITVDYDIGGRRGVRALDDVSLAVAPGESVAVMGVSGSGKSTLGLVLCGVLAAQAGSVSGSARVAMALQRPESALFGETVAEDVAFVATLEGLAGSEVDRRVEWALDAVGLDASFARRDPFALSGGEQRRVAIAGVLAAGPDVVILDEPTAGLDAYARNTLIARLASLGEHGVALVVITHESRDAARLCERLVVLDAGRIVHDGPTVDVLGSLPRTVALGLEPLTAVAAVDVAAHRRGVRPPTTIDETELVAFLATVARDTQERGSAWVQ